MSHFTFFDFVRHTTLALCFALGTTTLSAAPILIQEVLYDGLGGDADESFTELFGTPGSSLDGWQLVGINGFNGNRYRSIDLTGNHISADGTFVISTASASSSLRAESDFTANVDWQNGPDAVQLFNGSTLVDALQYGDAGAFNSGEGLNAEDVTAGFSLTRDILGSDTGNNATDFTMAEPSPGVGPVLANVHAQKVPEPNIISLLTLGLAGICFGLRNSPLPTCSEKTKSQQARA